MLFRGAFAAAASIAIAQAAAASNSTTKARLNGWFPCSELTFSDPGDQYAECATYFAPLCYSGVCEKPEFANPTIDIFVKRITATIGDHDTASNVWLLQGGPGYASNDLEESMIKLYNQLEGAANVYTMDHRGTGRSTLLECVAAQAGAPGSPRGTEIDPSEVPSCAQALENKYGDLAAFSVTSAATDLVTFISEFTNGARTIVYGLSYGTVLVERVMHLDPPEVTGYVLDGIATTSGASADKFFSLSERDTYFGEVGDHFLDLCRQDAICHSHFKEPNTLPNSLQSLLTAFDKDPNSTCATLVRGSKPSFTVRRMLGSMLMNAEDRKLIPPVVYRLNRCDKNDVEFLTQFTSSAPGTETLADTFYSPLLNYLIHFSEMWERPNPSAAVMRERYTNKSVARGLYSMSPLYCAFSKEKSPSCDGVDYTNYAANGIVYERDEYWNKTAKIPSQASVLLLSSKLDPQTPHKYAEYLLDVLDGDKKELITFPHSVHGILVSTQLDATDAWSLTCGVQLLASFVRNNGDLGRLDKSCLEQMPAFNLSDHQASNYGTTDLYDGMINSSLTAPQSDGVSA